MAELRAHLAPQQRLTFTPNLDLAFKVLQMPLTQLQAYLRQQLEENPLLESLDEPSEPTETTSSGDGSDESLDEDFIDLWRQADGSPADNIQEKEPLHREIPARGPSLSEHLLFQLRCLADSELDRHVAEVLVGWLDDDGYLRTPLDEIASTEGLEVAAVERALALVHRLDPPGVGARTLPECLLIQLAHLSQAESLAARIVQDHFELLSKRRFDQLATKLRVSLGKIQRAYETIRQLDPKPARNFTAEAVPVLTPDLIVERVQGGYEVELNDEGLPHLGLNGRYRSLLRDRSTIPDAKEFIREKTRQAVWLLKAINQRNTTLLAIARCMVELERDYLDHGVRHLKALTQEEVAKRVGCHPSTVSRAIHEKAIQTPYGIVPLKTFFGGGIAQTSGITKRLSARTVQAELALLIASEDHQAPLSDEVLTTNLIAMGYPVARRTVAKYRSMLNILPAHLRRRPAGMVS